MAKIKVYREEQFCANFKHGCQEFYSDSENREDHLKVCSYREVNCPILSCQDQGQMFILRDLTDHLKTHKEHLGDLMKSSDNKFEITYGGSDVDNRYKICRRLLTIDGSVFYTTARIIEKQCLVHWIYMIGSPQEVKDLITLYNMYR